MSTITTTEIYETPFERFNANNNLVTNDSDDEKAFIPLDTQTMISYSLLMLFIVYMIYLFICMFYKNKN
jgi:hypothetical protein